MGARLVLRYLSEKRKAFFLFFLCVLIFFAVCLLYQLDNLSKLSYAFFLCLFVGFCWGVFGFIGYRNRYKRLKEARLNMESIEEYLPEPAGSVEEQYRELLSALLEDRRRMLLAAGRKETEMTDYYTLWAHQIKTPIAAIGLLLQNRDENSALPRELFKIEQYVEMVLYYLRLESMSSDFVFKRYELRDIVNQAVKKHAVLFINSGLSFQMGDFNCRVVTDEKWLLFVIEQILSNALKYTPQGSITIQAEEDREQVRLILRDTGIGIRPEDLPRIFERGFTGCNGRLDKRSTGIGLYLCRQILDKLSHTIEVESEVGKGTRVCIGFGKLTEL
jgi:signal transduction histidine kinase